MGLPMQKPHDDSKACLTTIGTASDAHSEMRYPIRASALVADVLLILCAIILSARSRSGRSRAARPLDCGQSDALGYLAICQTGRRELTFLDRSVDYKVDASERRGR
jgi:hypothetical protein